MSRKAWMTWLALFAAIRRGSDGETGNPDPDPTLVGEFVDAAGDNTAEPGPAMDPDIIGVQVTIENGQMNLGRSLCSGQAQLQGYLGGCASRGGTTGILAHAPEFAALPVEVK